MSIVILFQFHFEFGILLSPAADVPIGIVKIIAPRWKMIWNDFWINFHHIFHFVTQETIFCHVTKKSLFKDSIVSTLIGQRLTNQKRAWKPTWVEKSLPTRREVYSCSTNRDKLSYHSWSLYRFEQGTTRIELSGLWIFRSGNQGQNDKFCSNPCPSHERLI